MDFFQRWLSEQMDARGWTGAQLAERLHITPGSVSKWLSRHEVGAGRHIPADDRLRRLAQAFDTPVEEVMWRAKHADQPYPAEANDQREQPTTPTIELRLACLRTAATFLAGRADEHEVLAVALRWTAALQDGAAA